MLFTSAGFFWLQAGVPGLLPYLLVEQKDVEGPEQEDEEEGVRRCKTSAAEDLHQLATYNHLNLHHLKPYNS